MLNRPIGRVQHSIIMRRRISVSFACTVAVLLAAAGCTATETVTITEAARASARPTVISAVEPPAESTPGTESTEPEATPSEDNAASPLSEGETGCTYLGVDGFGDMQIELRFTSTLTEQSDATAAYVVNQGARSVLAESTVFLEDLKPGERVRMSVDTVTNPPSDEAGISCSINEVVSLDFGTRQVFRPTAGDTCRFVELDFADDIQVELTIINPTDTNELAIDFALRGPGGVRFDDGIAFVEGATPGQATTHGADSFTEFPAWVSESDFSCEILAIQGF